MAKKEIVKVKSVKPDLSFGLKNKKGGKNQTLIQDLARQAESRGKNKEVVRFLISSWTWDW